LLDARDELADQEEAVRNIPHHMELAANFAWGSDLGGSDETIIARLHDRPVFVTHYPRACKAFYMKRNADNPRVVNNLDLLAPEGYGEIIGAASAKTIWPCCSSAYAKMASRRPTTSGTSTSAAMARSPRRLRPGRGADGSVDLRAETHPGDDTVCADDGEDLSMRNSRRRRATRSGGLRANAWPQSIEYAAEQTCGAAGLERGG